MRIIRSPKENAERPTSADLTETIAEQRAIEAWTGTGSVAFAEGTALDPWNHLPVKHTLGANYMVYDMTLGFGKIIDRLK
jgi:acetoacetate decarboxylase